MFNPYLKQFAGENLSGKIAKKSQTHTTVTKLWSGLGVIEQIPFICYEIRLCGQFVWVQMSKQDGRLIMIDPSIICTLLFIHDPREVTFLFRKLHIDYWFNRWRWMKLRLERKQHCTGHWDWTKTNGSANFTFPPPHSTRTQLHCSCSMKQ